MTQYQSTHYQFTSESVTEGHPDKTCDQLSDAVLDACLSQDPASKVAIDCLVKTNFVCVTGELTTSAQVNIEEIVRKKVHQIGYVGIEGFSYDTVRVQQEISQQSPDIGGGVFKQGVEDLDSIGAGDQGLMFGYACNETPDRMPMPISSAHALTRGLADLRHQDTLPYLRPDGKSQVTVNYDEHGKPVGVDTIVISTHHAETIDGVTDNAKIQAKIKADLWELLVLPTCEKFGIRPPAIDRFFCNPSGKFVIGGPQSDSGLTGRKIIVDTYGGYSRHGGGAFSGKDPSKVDRSAAYAARHIAKNIVGAGLADKCEVQVSYAIGKVEPTSIFVDTFGTGKVDNAKLRQIIENGDLFDLRPAAIIKTFDLRNLPAQRGGRFYQDVAAYGHFGRNDLDLPWERLDRVAALQQALS
jgi:S-adenosylmethionine synthetase